MKQYSSASRKAFMVFNVIVLTLVSLTCILPFIHLLALSFSSSSAVAAGRVGFVPIDFTTAAYEFALRGGKFTDALWVSVKRVVLGSPAMELTPAPGNLEDRLERQELLAAIRRLPPDFRDAILLHYYQGYGIAEIANMLHVPEGTISSRLSRGRKKLEEILKESGAQ